MFMKTTWKDFSSSLSSLLLWSLFKREATCKNIPLGYIITHDGKSKLVFASTLHKERKQDQRKKKVQQRVGGKAKNKQTPCGSIIVFINPKGNERKSREKQTSNWFSDAFFFVILDIVSQPTMEIVFRKLLCALKSLKHFYFLSCKSFPSSDCIHEHLWNLMWFWFVTFALAVLIASATRLIFNLTDLRWADYVCAWLN